ncbi:hypothetical protein [Sphingomonas sp.]|uniref:hypothetical protein n=1 Tax=Sphingomonas sp. TaxID=28214 RepID=UPI00286BB1DF|nr:hypothetical protein [Sphingomonas sp.]
MSSRITEFMSAKAWRYSAVEGLRGTIGITLAVLLAGIAGGLINHVQPSFLVPRLAKIAAIVTVLSFALFTAYARWGLWRGNQVKSK